MQAQVPEALRVTTHYVEVSVIARTKQGEPVRSLTRDDFTLLDEGRPQQISVFRAETARTTEAAPPLPANMFSNRPRDAGAAPSGASIILFDGLNTRFTDQVYARLQILKFIREMQPGDRVALYVMGRGPRVIQDFTSDAGALASALENHKSGAAPSLDVPLYEPSMAGAAQFDAWLGELTFGLYDYYGKDRAFRTVRALIAIAEHVERLPGRKNLIWVSGSFPVSIGGNSVAAPRKAVPSKRDALPDVERAARALSRADLAVYPVDARGLMASQEYTGSLQKPELRNPDTSEFGTMQMLAERTGGRAFFNNNDLAAALRRANDDARMSYVLGYYPSHNDWKGRFHKIAVAAKQPDVELQYRSGYFAQPDEPGDSWYRERVLNSALWSPMDATGLGLALAATPGAGGVVDLALQVDAPDIAFRHDDRGWSCELDVWMVQFDAREKQIKTDAHTNRLLLDRPMFDRVIEAKGLVLAEHLTPAPEAVLVRILVRDVSSGALGSLTMPMRRLRK
jgi:VWFA-related protein